MVDTDVWPMIKAKWYTAVAEPRKVRLIVIHDMEAPEGPLTAENIARYFADPRDRYGKPVKASAHINIDNNSIVRCVDDNNVAYAAPGANNDGIQIELAGYGKQTRAEWLDAYGLQLLNLAANATAQYCLKFGIPIRQLTNTQLQKGSWGIIGHYQASAVYKRSTHTDPGKGFPWDRFIPTVAAYHAARSMAYAKVTY